MKKRKREREEELRRQLADARREIDALKAAVAGLMQQPKVLQQAEWWRGYPWESPWHCSTTWTYATP